MSDSDGGATGGPSARGLGPAALTGLASMTGAGLFVTLAPAAATAGGRVLISVLLAAVVAAVSAHSSTRLAAAGRAEGARTSWPRRVGLPWANLAGWAFLAGATAACAALAISIGVHLWPDNAKIVGIAAVLAALALHLRGFRRTLRGPRIVVALTITLVLVFAAVLLISPPVTVEAPPAADPEAGDLWGVLRGAGLLFFAFVGFGQVATVRGAPAEAPRTIARATAVALGVTTAVLLMIALALTRTLGAGWVAARKAPLAEAAEISAWPWLGVLLRIAAVLTAGGVLLALLLGASRAIVAMAEERHLPTVLVTLDGPHGMPRRAVAVIAGLAVTLVVLIDLRSAIALSAFLLLGYHAIAHACAWALDSRPVARLLPALGLIGCVLLAAMLPWPSIVAGLLILALGAVTGWVRYATREGRSA